MIRGILFGLLMLSVPVAARAETLYVTDVLVVLLRAGPGPETATVKQLTSGVALEVQETRGAYARVRDAQGASGWIEARYLVRSSPAGARLAQVQTELDQARARVTDLERRLSESAAVSSPPVSPAPAAERMDPEVPWIGISSAMLVIGLIGGFIGGVSWLRARTRRKLGGMTINIRNL